MQVFDLSKSKTIAGHTKVAKGFLERFRGLIGSAPLQEGEALWIPHCQGIHTFGMAYPIDAVYLNANMKIVRGVEKMRPYSFGPISFQTASVLELSAGSIRKLKIKTGDFLLFVEDLP